MDQNWGFWSFRAQGFQGSGFKAARIYGFQDTKVWGSAARFQGSSFLAGSRVVEFEGRNACGLEGLKFHGSRGLWAPGCQGVKF